MCENGELVLRTENKCLNWYFQGVNNISMWAKPMMPLLLMPVPQSLVETFVGTLTFPNEAQMCSEYFLK